MPLPRLSLRPPPRPSAAKWGDAGEWYASLRPCLGRGHPTCPLSCRQVTVPAGFPARTDRLPAPWRVHALGGATSPPPSACVANHSLFEGERPSSRAARPRTNCLQRLTGGIGPPIGPRSQRGLPRGVASASLPRRAPPVRYRTVRIGVPAGPSWGAATTPPSPQFSRAASGCTRGASTVSRPSVAPVRTLPHYGQRRLGTGGAAQPRFGNTA